MGISTRKLQFVLLCTILALICQDAKPYVYTVRDGSEWCYWYTDSNSQFYYYLRFEGDTTFTYHERPQKDSNGTYIGIIADTVTYGKLYQIREFDDGHVSKQLLAYMRENLSTRFSNRNWNYDIGQYTRDVTQLWGDTMGYANNRMRNFWRAGEAFYINGEYKIYTLEDITGIYIDNCTNFMIPYSELQVHKVLYPYTDTIPNLRTFRRECVEIVYQGQIFARVIEGIGFVPVWEGVSGDLASYDIPYAHPEGRRTRLVYMKTPEGEFEYLDESLLPQSSVKQTYVNDTSLKVRRNGASINVSIDGDTSPGQVAIVSMDEKVCATSRTQDGNASLDASALDAGVYVITYRNQVCSLAQKILLP